MNVIKYPKINTWAELGERPVFDPAALEETVAGVLKDVQENGDKAVLSYTSKFDGVDIETPIVTAEEIEAGAQLCDPALQDAIKLAYDNIVTFHSAQKEVLEPVETAKGVSCWRKSLPIEKVGLYIPGGTAPLFSTTLMLGAPAKIAGCKEIVLCTPPDKEGKVHPAILFTAKLLGITKVFKLGGVQAIAAMAYGTETVPATYKIFGPGNQYVTCAKQLISKAGVAIDLPAGPSELLVIADKSAEPAFVAADLLSQAEHGVDSQVILLCDDESKLEACVKEVANQVAVLPRKEIALQALEKSRAILLENKEEMLAFSNMYAPEHLIIASDDDEFYQEGITEAGSVFLGHYTPESAGDYASGTNHTLPTNGYARAYSGVSLDSFIKKITFQKIDKTGIAHIGPSIEIMAENELLQAHKNAVTVRLKALQ